MENKNLKGKKASASSGGAAKKTTKKAGSKKTAGKKTSKKAARKAEKQEGKKGGLLTNLIMLFAFGILAVSIYQIVMMVLPYYQGGQEYDKVKELAVTEPKPEEDGEGEKPGDGFQVDFEALLAENPDTVAWIRLEEPAVISYPVVKSQDNEEYLTKTFSANDNKLGAIFLDKRSSSSFSDRNSFIYGHNLKVGGEMFSQLNAYADEEFCKQHPYFYIYTPDGMTKVYQVFSAGVVNAMADNYNLDYDTDEEFMDYLELCRSSSNYQMEADLHAGSRIVSLSTCTNVLEDERFLLQGVLIEEY
ncbi:SrtB family sortase [Lachnospiraceae bacterium]|jgi:sortase B|nr:class B sortase [uncultured Schaedlerella sp.]MCI9153159.1 class B sortase [Ruminococcus sp.]NBI57696.1 SrtB family sortase [Lachnospiraceae bacterium]